MGADFGLSAAFGVGGCFVGEALEIVEMRNRNRLSVTKLDDFVQWCVSEGWENEPTKGDWEVARLKRDAKRAFVWRRASNLAGTPLQHLTMDRYADVLFMQWKRDAK